MEEKKNKPTMLIYSDSPYATTGLGTLTAHMISMFQDRFDITVFGINHNEFIIRGSRVTPLHDRKKYNCSLITPLPNAGLGHNDFAAFLHSNKFDLILTSHDWNNITPVMEDILQYRLTNDCKWITYIPIDRKYYYPAEAEMLKDLDFIVTLSDFATNKILDGAPYLQEKIKRIYHPIDISEYKAPSKKDLKEFKKQYFERVKGDDIFLVGWVDRNLFRKDPHKAVRIFSKFKDKHADARLYMHCSQISHEGYDIGHSFMSLDVDRELVELPKLSLETHGIQKHFMNLLYRSFNVKISTSLGEGFGYTNVEAMAAGIPVIAPNNTTFPELINDNGYLVDCDDEYLAYGVNSMARDSVDTRKFVETLEYVYVNYEEAKEKALSGREWVRRNLNLEVIKQNWNEVFDKLSL